MSVKRVTINGTRVMARMSPATTSTLPCATYSRVSTDDQVLAYGLTSQRHELRELAGRKGCPVAAEFSDEGISGATLDRPALTQLRDGVRDGRYRVVLVHAPTGSRARLSNSSCFWKSSSGPAPASSS
jgi:Resolvase, N terminal domain